MANPKGQAKEIAEKPVGSDKTQAPSKVGTEAVNSAEYANLGKPGNNEYSLLPGLNVQMEQKGWLPSLSVSMDTQKMVDAAGQGINDAGKALKEGVNGALRGAQDQLNDVFHSAEDGLNATKKNTMRWVADRLYDADYMVRRNKAEGQQKQADMPHQELKVTQMLADRSMDSYNCHFLVKAHIEGKIPEESGISARQEQVTPQYLKSHGYEEIPPKDIKPGDVILVEDNTQPGATYYSHSALVSKVENGRISETFQKANPDGPVEDLSGKQFKATFLPEGQNLKYHIYRNPQAEGRLE